ncbi:penicillin-binding transpeptidase domain-containing protein [Clostridium sediminicola]|uniref:penicillin-binding transpeptidase domain-containing protein n=1 Tax=Clostridium sediminicola TaxID=3114879 RepID=UPI0031F22330
MFYENKLSIKKRIVILFSILIFLFTYLVYKMVKLQYIEADKLVSIADSQFTFEETTSDLNYNLADCNGKNLLNYNEEFYIVIDPYSFAMNNHNTKIDDLYALDIILRNYNTKYDLRTINTGTQSQILKWKIDKATYNKIQSINGVKGYYVTRKQVVDRENHFYSIENLISNYNKYSSDGEIIEKNKDSLEGFIHSKTKKNEPIKKVFKKNTEGTFEDEGYYIPENNKNVRLTIDSEIQKAIKDILNSEKYNDYKQIGVVMMEADTGKIKALVQKDDSLPNIILGISTNNGYYPGSIMKAVIEEAGLESNKISLNNIYKNKHLFNDHINYDYMNVETAFIASSNNIFADIGVEVGINEINGLLEEYGMFEKVLNMDLEQSGKYEGDINDVGDTQLASFGQKHRITMLEALAIPNTIINDGIYVKPYILDAFVDNDNNKIEEYPAESKRVISKDTARILKNQMIQVVTNSLGTGSKAYSEFIDIGGKTGTATRIDKNNEIYDGWFAGFYSMGEKKYSMIVFIEDIGDKSGGDTCAPIFKEICENIYS